ncbi:MAG: hypothetical protein B9S33_21145 [Pedosphaera sp. Tous-C6FEB]|nr:MAG: hypothetical protein B9S33_21145 [Pedosphaera sp. Tous-C6FEB]
MQCPADHTALREVQRGSFSLCACGSCHGLWLTREALKQAFVSQHPPERLDEAEPQPPLLHPAKTRHCPSCDCPLAARWLHGIEIDACQKCQGVWLDAGELRQIISHYQQRGTAAPPTGSNAAPARPGAKWYDGVDVPCDCDFLVVIGSGLGELTSGGVDATKAVAEFLGDALSLLDW